MTRRFLVLIAAVTALAAALRWGIPPSITIPQSVVIVTLDTTRADRLPVYGYMDVAMPHLERLATEGIVFDQATSVAPLTLPAHVSLFTGLLPPAHGVRDNGDPPLADGHVTLAEVLRTEGFRTAAFVGSVVLDADRGLAQGFERYDGIVSAGDEAPFRRQRPAGEVIEAAVSWLGEAAGSRFFLWAHLYDPHRPYDPPAPFRSIPDPYVGEIAYADSQLGRLLDALEAHALMDQTLVVVVGDHGESLGEHGERDHGIFVYESVLRVPFIVRAPGLPARRIPQVVRLTDVMPTVLDLLGVSGSPAIDGVSLAAVMRGSRHSLQLEAYAESLYPQRFGWSPVHALREGRFKFIEAPRPELYDLDRDPFEERNLHDERGSVARAMRRRLMEITRHGADSPADHRAGEVSPQLRNDLAALGYVGHARREPLMDRAAMPDPKDCIGIYNARLQPREKRMPAAPGCGGSGE